MDANQWGSETPESFKVLQDALAKLQEMNPELSKVIKEELDAAARGEENILLVGTDGDFSVTILHLTEDVIGSSEEMVLFPTSSSISILAAVSRESLERKVRMCEAMDEDGDGALADQMWDD